jgi:hypothetical protein
MEQDPQALEMIVAVSCEGERKGSPSMGVEQAGEDD